MRRVEVRRRRSRNVLLGTVPDPGAGTRALFPILTKNGYEQVELLYAMYSKENKKDQYMVFVADGVPIKKLREIHGFIEEKAGK